MPAAASDSRPPGSRGRPPSDRGRAQCRRGLRAALRRLGRPRRPGDGRQGHLRPARRGLRRHRPGDARRPPPRLGDDRPQLPGRDRPAAGAPRPRRAADQGLPRPRRPARDPAEALALAATRSRSTSGTARWPTTSRSSCRSARSCASTSPRSPSRTSRASCASPRCRARCSSRPRSATTPPSSAARPSASPTSRASTSPSRAPSSTAASPPPASARCAGSPSSTAGDVSFEDLERIISSDVGLSLKLLRYVNSRLLRAAADRLVGARGADHARRAHRPPLGDGHGHLLDPRRPGRARRPRPPPRPHVRDPRRQRPARGARDAVHDRPLLRRRRAAGHADGRRARDSLPFTEEIQAALLRREGPKGELLAAVTAYERGEFPTLPTQRRPPRRWPAPTAPPWSGRTRRGRAIA